MYNHDISFRTFFWLFNSFVSFFLNLWFFRFRLTLNNGLLVLLNYLFWFIFFKSLICWSWSCKRFLWFICFESLFWFSIAQRLLGFHSWFLFLLFDNLFIALRTLWLSGFNFVDFSLNLFYLLCCLSFFANNWLFDFFDLFRFFNLHVLRHCIFKSALSCYFLFS